MTRVTDWKPGDAAVIGCSEVTCADATHPAIKGKSGGWHLLDIGEWSEYHGEPIRRLVVIDAEDWGEIERLTMALRDAVFTKTDRYPGRHELAAGLQAALREFANPTVRIEEPTGLGAVVEDAEGFTWVRTHATGYPWHANLQPDDRNATAVRKYERINVVRVLSEGVPAEADR